VPAPRASAEVLADRIAAALVHREPGWRLPRRSALARRYNVSLPEIDVAIAELVRRALIRRLPDGQLFRTSPAEYLIPLEGVTGLATRLDPMGGEIVCQARHVSQRDAPQDVAWALGVDGDAQVRIVRSVWTAGGEPAAISTAYVREPFAGPLGTGTLDTDSPDTDSPDTDSPDTDSPGASSPGNELPGEDMPGGEEPRAFAKLLSGIPAGDGLGDGADLGVGAYARAVDLELSPPQPSVARSLRLLPGQSAVSVTIRFDDAATGEPAGLTVVILRPELFRVVIHAGNSLPPGTSSSAATSMAATSMAATSTAAAMPPDARPRSA
jgi:hypothetical protein